MPRDEKSQADLANQLQRRCYSVYDERPDDWDLTIHLIDSSAEVMVSCPNSGTRSRDSAAGRPPCDSCPDPSSAQVAGRALYRLRFLYVPHHAS